MVHSRLLSSAVAMALVLSFGLVGAASALTATCVGTPTATTITWTGLASDGVVPFSFLWGNGSTSTSQPVAALPGLHSMTLQVTDASSRMATTPCATPVAQAATSTPPAGSLAAQIKALLDQINALKAQIVLLLQQQAGGSGSTATSTRPFPPGCFVFNRDLKHGDRGDDVRELQRTLASDPSIFPAEMATGFFGSKTREALMKFQRKFGINSTGFFGPLSRGFLKENCGKADTDHDGILNSVDTDDDNDGVSDDKDSHPLNKNVSTSTKSRSDDDRDDDNKRGGNDRGRNGNSDDD